MTAVPRRLAVCFLLALLGVLAVLGAVAWQVGGGLALAAYAVCVVGLLVVLAARARATLRAAQEAAGRTCTCCATSQHDPVRVV